MQPRARGFPAWADPVRSREEGADTFASHSSSFLELELKQLRPKLDQ